MPLNYTAIPDGSQATADLFNTRFEQLDQAMGEVADLDTTANTLTEGVNEVLGKLNTVSDTDGTLKAGAVDNAAVLANDVVTTAKILNANVTTAKIADANVTTAKIADANITNAKLAGDVAGDGLSGGAGNPLQVNTDGATVEVSGDSLRVKDSGISTNKLASQAVTGAKVTDRTLTFAKIALDDQLKQWTAGENFEPTSATYHGTYTSVVATATIKWPDGSAGTFTTTDIDTDAWAIDAFEITHVDGSRKVTQAAVTRNTDGSVTAKPALTVGAL